MEQLPFINTLAEADIIIMILFVIVIVLLVLGGIGLRQSRIIRQRNEQLYRILNALDDYRAIVPNREQIDFVDRYYRAKRDETENARK